MNYPMALVYGIAIISFSMVTVKLIEEYFNFKRTEWYNEYKAMKAKELRRE